MTDRPSEMAPLTRGATQRGGHRIRLLIADDHALLRQALRTLLDGQDGLEVVGEASNGRDAVEAAERLLPDVVLMDMVMPGLNGIEATRQITKRVPGCRILILTAYLEDERLLQALRSGANGYVVKNSDLEELLLAVRSVHRGNTYFSSAVSEEIAVNEVLMQAKQPVPRTGYDLLTNRERGGLLQPAHRRRAGDLREDGGGAQGAHHEQAPRPQPHGPYPLRHQARPGGPREPRARRAARGRPRRLRLGSVPLHSRGCRPC